MFWGGGGGGGVYFLAVLLKAFSRGCFWIQCFFEDSKASPRGCICIQRCFFNFRMASPGGCFGGGGLTVLMGGECKFFGGPVKGLP